MSRIEELPDNFNEAPDRRHNVRTARPPSDSAGIPESVFSQLPAFPLKPGAEKHANPSQPSADLPPGMASVKQYSADELLTMMNRMPLFMTSLDETDGEGGENIELEAIKALAYEGTRAEIAGNFREQGNECARAKNWNDAREYYAKALAALKAPQTPQDREEGAPDMEVVEIDEEAEAKKEREIEEACCVNRALCNLEKKNYRSCIHDCAAALRLNPDNVKAWYRSASACLALDKIPEAEDACKRGLLVDPKNAAFKTLSAKIAKRKEQLEALERKRIEREERQRAEKCTLELALKGRNIPTRTTDQAPEMEDAAIKLADPLDASSSLSFPVILLYPVHLQSDFIKSFEEGQSLGEHLSYIFPLPWDEQKEYTPESVDCYIETTSGGLIKAGKKLPLLKILNSGKVEIVDGLLRVNVVPHSKVSAWIEEFKKRRTA